MAMPAMKIGFNVRALRFDHPRVIKAVDDATYRALLRSGQYVRKVARHSIKTRPGPSAPGQPPHSQIGRLKQFIYYGFDPAARSVVVGPARLRDAQTYGSMTVPELLEGGGVVRMSDRNARRLGVARGTMARYEARPYMGPAQEAGFEKVDDFWRDSVK